MLLVKKAIEGFKAEQWCHRFGSPFRKAAGGKSLVFASAQWSLGAASKKLPDN